MPLPNLADSPAQPAPRTAPVSRRHVLASLATVSAVALLAPLTLSRADGLVEVNGWILRRSDLA